MVFTPFDAGRYAVASVLGKAALYLPCGIILAMFPMVANTFLMGIVLITIGLVALYIGTIHTEVINRLLYVVRERMNFHDGA